MVGILALIDRFIGEAKNGRFSISVPGNLEVTGHLKKVRFLEALEKFGAISGEGRGSIEPDEDSPFFPIMVGQTEGWVDEVVGLIVDQCQHKFQGIASLLDPVYTIFAELASNAVQHSECGRVWVLAQYYAKSRMIEIAVADSGISIPQSLRRNPDLHGRVGPDVEAVSLAFEEGTSGLDDPNRGGLHHIRNELSVNERKLLIRSGTGSVTVYHDGRLRLNVCGHCWHPCQMYNPVRLSQTQNVEQLWNPST